MHLLHSKKIKVLILTAIMTALFTVCAFAANVTTVKVANLYKSADSSSEVQTALNANMTRKVLRTVNKSSGTWYKIKANGKTGYVNAEFVSTEDTSDKTAPVETKNDATEKSSMTVNESSYSGTENTTDFGVKVCSIAKKYLGCNYVYGSEGKIINGVMAFDCSGFTSYVYRACGKSIPRTSGAQYASSAKISQASLRPGDLVFYATNGGSTISHVGMYIGDGEFIHAANSKSGVIISGMNEKYYSQRYVGAGRY